MTREPLRAHIRDLQSQLKQLQAENERLKDELKTFKVVKDQRFRFSVKNSELQEKLDMAVDEIKKIAFMHLMESPLGNNKRLMSQIDELLAKLEETK